MGIKRKILLGFISIGTLLLLSGIISTLELVNFNRSTQKLLANNRANIELSKEMLDAVQEQNTALLLNVADSIHTRHNSMLMDAKEQFDSAYAQAVTKFGDSPKLQLLKQTYDDYSNVIAEINQTTTFDWFSKVYKTSYLSLTNAIKDFMVDTQQRIIDYTVELERNAYRATMVGIIALAGGLVLIMMFYYLINIYILAPIIAMHKSLNRHIELRMPFDVQISTKDEIMTLRDDINRVIEKTKR